MGSWGVRIRAIAKLTPQSWHYQNWIISICSIWKKPTVLLKDVSTVTLPIGNSYLPAVMTYVNLRITHYVSLDIRLKQWVAIGEIEMTEREESELILRWRDHAYAAENFTWSCRQSANETLSLNVILGRMVWQSRGLTPIFSRQFWFSYFRGICRLRLEASR